MPTKVLLDTDIGSDIDDAVALAYLLAQSQCHLLGVTTVTGQALERAMLASAICRRFGREDVPICPGAESPILIPQEQTEAPQASILARWPHEKDFPRGEAVEFMRRTIRANPGEVVLLAIGPLTNAGLLFAVDPEAAGLLKALVMMAGSFTEPMCTQRPREWNARGDYHATSIVYRTPVRVHRSVGLDVTMKCRMPAAEVRRRFGEIEKLAPVLDMAEVWFEKRDAITFHDPLAAASIFDEAILTFERGTVEVETEDKSLGGRTRWTPGPPDAPHEVAVKVARDRFFDHFFSVF